jgi:hypothetical protein
MILCHARDLGILDIIDWVGAASVLRECRVVVVNLSSIGIEDNILQDRAKFDSIEDIRFLFGRQTDALGVATSLNVEDTLV